MHTEILVEIRAKTLLRVQKILTVELALCVRSTHNQQNQFGRTGAA